MRVSSRISSKRPGLVALQIATSALFCGVLSGCGLTAGTSSNTGGVSGATQAKAQGSVHGGQQPVSGAQIQLYTVGTNGPGTTSTALIASSVTTSDGSGNALNSNANAGNGFNSYPAGSFTITGDYSCNSATEVYIVATGGNAGAGTNSGLSIVAALGACSKLSASTFINMNELTTVAADYALAPFMTDLTHVGATGSNPIALVNAFNVANLLVSTSTGAVGSAPAGMSLPSARLNTLADILAACVNSSGSGSSPCQTLFTATGATETSGAGLAIAKNPGKSTYPPLFSLATSAPPFQPGLTAQPNDFTLAINYAGTELLSPYGLAIDAVGNAWVTNQAGRSVVKLPALSTSFATSTFSVGGLLAPRGISIDRTGNIWIANTGANNVVELSSSGSLLSGSGYTGGGVSAPVAIANDSAGNAWVANFAGNSLTEFGSTGTATGASPITGSSALSSPTAVALDSTGRVAVANAGTGQVCLFNNSAVLQNCISDGLLFGATSVAVNSAGALALSGSTTGTTVAGAFTLASTAGTVNVASPVTGGGLNLPNGIAYDGAGIAWFTNTNSLSQFSSTSAISPSAGLGAINNPVGIAVDMSGNVWTANSGDNSVSVFIGLATPLITPLAANVGP